MLNTKYELLYDGEKEMMLLDVIDNKDFLSGLFNLMYYELPAPKPKNNK